MAKIKDVAEMNIVVNLSLWSALKLRIAGITNYIANEKDEKLSEDIDMMVTEIRERGRKAEQEMKKCSDCKVCEHAVSESSIEKRLAKIEKRLELLEQTEQVETPKKPEFLLEMFKVIADTYAAGEVNEAIQLLRVEISKAARHYHNMPKEDVYWDTGNDQL